METVWEILLAVFASTGFWTLINNVVSNRKAKKSAINEAVLGLLHDRIYYLCNKYIECGEITPGEFDNLRYLYEPYHNGLKGNGTGERLWEEVKRLPIKN